MSEENNHLGKTLWEMFKDRFDDKESAPQPFYNPMDYRIGSMVPVGRSRVEWKEYDFTVTEIRQYLRRIGGKEFRFSDYVLGGIDTRSFAAEDRVQLRLRAVPNLAGAFDTLLLELDDELGFDAGFLEVVKDESGIFEVTEKTSGAVERFSRINDVKDSYEAAVLVVSATHDTGTVEKSALEKVEYWDYWREVPQEKPGTPQREFLFVEMKGDTGWFQLWRGEEFFFPAS